MLKRLLPLLLVLSISAVCGLMAGDYIYTNQRFPGNVFIENIDVSGLTVGEAINKLEEADVDSACRNFITLYTTTESFEFAPSEIGAFIRPRTTAYNAFRAAYEESYFKGLMKRTTKERRRLTLPLQLGLYEETISAVLADIASKEDVPSVEARCILLPDNKYRITRERIGRGVNKMKTLSALLDTFRAGKRSSPIVIETLLPKVLRKDLVSHPPITLIAKYRTHYGSHDSPNRIHNIKLISSGINNYIMLSGEVFSLAADMGDTSKERGFKEAFVIIKGELVPHYGGGACQVATTLFNTAMLADLEIVKRRNHAIYFFIYPLGRDAAVYAGQLDLELMNNTGFPIMFKTEATDNGLTMSIYGTPTGKSVSFSPPEIFVQKDKRTTEVSYEGFGFNDPFITVVEKTVSLNGKVLKKEVIKSYYRFAGENGRVNIVRPEPE